MWLRLCFSNLRKIWTSLTLISSLLLWSLTFYPLAYQACFSIRQKLKTGKSPGGKYLLLTHRGKEINKKRISFPCRNTEQLLCAGRAVASVDHYTQCEWCASLKFWNLIICVSVAPISLLAKWVTEELSGERQKDESDKPALFRTCISTHKRVRCGSPPFWKLLIGRNSCDTAAVHGTKVTAGCFYLFIWLCHVLCGIQFPNQGSNLGLSIGSTES